MEKIYKLVVGDLLVHVNSHQRASDFFDTPGIVRDRQLWVRRQTVGRQHRIVCGDHLIGRNALDLVDDVRWQLWIVGIQSGHNVGLVGDIQRSVLVRDVADGRLVRRDDERTVDEHRVGEVLGDGNAQRVEVLDVTYA